jgi:hypothetical protein
MKKKKLVVIIAGLGTVIFVCFDLAFFSRFYPYGWYWHLIFIGFIYFLYRRYNSLKDNDG